VTKNPEAGVSVKLYDPYTGDEKYAGITASNGVASITGIIPNRYTLSLWKNLFDGYGETLDFYTNPTNYTKEITPQ
jgi:hypothetical protein